jgi:hypothetical protein
MIGTHFVQEGFVGTEPNRNFSQFDYGHILHAGTPNHNAIF